MIGWIAQRLAARRIRQAGRQAFNAGRGFVGRGWPVDRAQSLADRSALAQELCDWLRFRIAQTATPYGISHCCILIRLANAAGLTAAVTYRSTEFERLAVSDELEKVRHHIQSLELDQHPSAIRIEAHLISLGEIIRHVEAQRAAKRH